MYKYSFNKIMLSSLISLFLSSAFASNNESTPIGRYLSVQNKPSYAQVNLLSQSIQLRFPQDVQTIGEAMTNVLRLSGYSLVSAHYRESALKTTLLKPLPAINRHLGPMPLKDALSTLAGPAFSLVDDPLNRTVNFKVKPQYQRFTVHTKSFSRKR